MMYFFISSICAFVSKQIFIPRLQLQIDVSKNIVSMTLVSLNVRSKQFTRSYLWGSLYERPVSAVLDSGKKISKKIFSVLMQTLGFRLYEMVFSTKQATPLPFRD